LYNKIILHQQHNKYNVKQVDDWFNKIDNPTSLNTGLKDDIKEMLSFLEYSYGRNLSDALVIFEQIDELREKEKLNNKPKIQYEVLRDDVTLRRKLPVIRDDVGKDIDNLFKSSKKRRREKDMVAENNNLLNIKNKDNNSSSSSSSFFSFSVLTSSLGRDFSNVNEQFRDELNLHLQQLT
jgi:hypothetical protein